MQNIPQKSFFVHYIFLLWVNYVTKLLKYMLAYKLHKAWIVTPKILPKHKYSNAGRPISVLQTSRTLFIQSCLMDLYANKGLFDIGYGE